MRADSAVDPTRSENITVTWRRSAAVSLVVWRMAEVLLRASARAPWPLAQNFDCLKQLAAVSNSRHAQILEVVRRQLWQDGGVNFVLAEFRLVFVEAEAPQPPTDVHDGALLLLGSVTCPGFRGSKRAGWWVS